MEAMKYAAVRTLRLNGTLRYNGVPVVKYDIKYPEFYSGRYPFAARRMNAFYRQKAAMLNRHIRTDLYNAAVADYKNSIANDFPVHIYEAIQTFNITYNEDCLLSLYMEYYEYTGGAHGSTERTSQTWNMNNGRILPLDAFFRKNFNYTDHLKKIINRQIEEQIANGTGAYFDNYRELVDKAFNPENYYLTPEALAIYFQQYDIAPYSSGIPTFMIPYAEARVNLPDCRP